MSNNNVEKIKERLDIVDVLGSYLKLEKAGRNYKAKCPFHNEKTASFFISTERQNFYCFGCQAKGDIFSFVERFEGLDFKGALKHLADRAGIELTKRDEAVEDERERLFSLLEASTQFFEKNIKKQMEATSYIKNRGVSDESIANWRIGFAPLEWRSCLDELEARGFKKPDIALAGMSKQTEDGSKHYDTFRGRIMFPIFDTARRPIAFSGRILHDDGKSPKYLNSPETELFKKSEVLYGLNFAKNEIRRLDYAVLVEGQMDLVLAHQAGTKNSVASSGTALTLAHLEKISKISKKILIAYDADEAGRNAAKRVGEMALSLGMDVKVASFPDGEDPASVIGRSVEEWKESLKNSEELVAFLTKRAIEKSGKNELKLAKEIRESVLPSIASAESEILKSQYISIVAKLSRIPEQSIREDVKKVKIAIQSGVAVLGRDAGLLREEDMLAGIILWQESLTEPKFELGTYKQKLTELGIDIEEILSDKDRDALIFEAENKWNTMDIESVLKELLARLEKKHLEKRLREIGGLIDSASEGEKEKLQEEASQISKQLSKIN